MSIWPVPVLLSGWRPSSPKPVKLVPILEVAKTAPFRPLKRPTMMRLTAAGALWFRSVCQHGYRAASRALGIDGVTLARIANNPSVSIQRKTAAKLQRAHEAGR